MNSKLQVGACCDDTGNTKAAKRLRRALFVAMAVYVAATFAVVWLTRHVGLEGPVLYVAALAPALPLVWLIAQYARYLRDEVDEFARAVMMRAMLWGLGAVLVFSTVWGFLENFAEVPRFDLYLVFPLFGFCMGIAQILVRRSFR